MGGLEVRSAYEKTLYLTIAIMLAKKLMLSLMTETVDGTMTVVESPSMSFKLKEQDSNEMK